jgi:hypothetical protein
VIALLLVPVAVPQSEANRTLPVVATVTVGRALVTVAPPIVARTVVAVPTVPAVKTAV